MKPSQKDKVIALLKSQGYVSRNWCLANFISRLSAIVQDLEAEGWELQPYRDKGDFCYRVVKPATKTVFKVEEREGKYYKVAQQVTI